MLKVRLREGRDGAIEEFDIHKDEATIGRLKSNDIVLPRPNVSKRHARVMVRDGEVVIADLGSTNGTYVGDHKIAAATLVRPGDKVIIGDFILELSYAPGEVEHEAASPPPVPEPPPLPTEPPGDAAQGGGTAIFASPSASPTAVLDTTSGGEPTVEPTPALSQEPAPALPPEPVPSPPSAPASSPPAPAARMEALDVHLAAVREASRRALDGVFRGRDLEAIDADAEWETLEEQMKEVVRDAVRDGAIEGSVDVDAVALDALYELTGLGPLEHLLADPEVEAIHVDGPDQIVVRRRRAAPGAPPGGVEVASGRAFSGLEAYHTTLLRLARMVAREEVPSLPTAVGGVMQGDTHVAVFGPPLVQAPGTAVITRASRRAGTLEDWLTRGRIAPEEAERLAAVAASADLTVAVVGPLPASWPVVDLLTSCIPSTQRIVLLEARPRLAVERPGVLRVRAIDPACIPPELWSDADRIIIGDVAADVASHLLRRIAAVRGGVVIALHSSSSRPDAPLPLEVFEEMEAGVEGLLDLVDVVVECERRGDAVAVRAVRYLDDEHGEDEPDAGSAGEAGPQA